MFEVRISEEERGPLKSSCCLMAELKHCEEVSNPFLLPAMQRFCNQQFHQRVCMTIKRFRQTKHSLYWKIYCNQIEKVLFQGIICQVEEIVSLFENLLLLKCFFFLIVFEMYIGQCLSPFGQLQQPYHGWDVLPIRHLLCTVLEAGKSKIKALEALRSGERLLPGSDSCLLTVSSHGTKISFIRALIPFMKAPPIPNHFPVPSH